MSEYAERDIVNQGNYYSRHTSAMTGEGLHSKSDIAAELAHRDIEIDRIQSDLTAAKAEIERLRGRLDSYICAVSTMDIVTQKAYVSGAATVHNIKQIVAETAEKGGDDEPA